MTEPQKIPMLNAKINPVTGAPVPITHADLPAAPGIANPAPNHFKVFFEKIGHKIASIVTWAPSFASKVVKVVNSAEKMTPEFDAGLHLIIKDISVIVANAALAAAQKGLNPSEDYDTLVALETLVKDFNVFWPVVAKEFDTIEGIFHEPGVPVTNEPGFPPATPAAVADNSSAYAAQAQGVGSALEPSGKIAANTTMPLKPITNAITPEMLGANQQGYNEQSPVPQFVPKTPKPV